MLMPDPPTVETVVTAAKVTGAGIVGLGSIALAFRRLWLSLGPGETEAKLRGALMDERTAREKELTDTRLALAACQRQNAETAAEVRILRRELKGLRYQVRTGKAWTGDDTPPEG